MAFQGAWIPFSGLGVTQRVSHGGPEKSNVTSGLARRASRFAEDEFWVNDDFASALMLAAAFAEDAVEDDVADLLAGNVNGGKRGRAELGEADVVKAGDGDIARDMQAMLAEFTHGAHSHEIVDAENSSGAESGIEQFAGGLAATFKTIRCSEDFGFCAR